jgi:hypothetical protein
MTMARILNISGTEIKDNGIRKLAEYVESHLPDDFTLVIGCKPSIYDVDAVLIGLGNIYAIECKDWKGNIKGGTYGWWQKDGQVIENPLQQTRNNTVALGKWLRKISPDMKNAWVKGLLVFTHEEGELHLDISKDSNSGVAVKSLNRLKEWVQKQNSSIDSETISSTMNWFCSLSNKDNDKSDLGKEVFIAIVISAIVLIIFGLYSLFYIGLFNAFYFLLVRPSAEQNKFKNKHINIFADNSYSVSGLSDDHLASRRYTDGS